MIEGLKATIPGQQLREVLLDKASKQRDTALTTNSPQHAELAALLSFLADNLESDEHYRLPLEQILQLRLHEERIQ